jgi:hypothetical protein
MMYIKSPCFFRLAFFLLLCSSMTLIGCPTGLPLWSGNGFIRKELLEDKKIAILPFEGDPAGEVSYIFAEKFHEKFPKITLVRSAEVLEVFPYEELYSERIDEATRKKIGQVFGVQALVAGNIYSPTVLRWLLQIQIIDVESGQILGRSLVKIDYVGPEGVIQAGIIAVKNLEPR